LATWYNKKAKTKGKNTKVDTFHYYSVIMFLTLQKKKSKNLPLGVIRFSHMVHSLLWNYSEIIQSFYIFFSTIKLLNYFLKEKKISYQTWLFFILLFAQWNGNYAFKKEKWINCYPWTIFSFYFGFFSCVIWSLFFCNFFSLTSFFNLYFLRSHSPTLN
jgi:hypothetical protein